MTSIELKKTPLLSDYSNEVHKDDDLQSTVQTNSNTSMLKSMWLGARAVYKRKWKDISNAEKVWLIITLLIRVIIIWKLIEAAADAHSQIQELKKDVNELEQRLYGAKAMAAEAQDTAQHVETRVETIEEQVNMANETAIIASHKSYEALDRTSNISLQMDYIDTRVHNASAQLKALGELSKEDTLYAFTDPRFDGPTGIYKAWTHVCSLVVTKPTMICIPPGIHSHSRTELNHCPYSRFITISGYGKSDGQEFCRGVDPNPGPSVLKIARYSANNWESAFIIQSAGLEIRFLTIEAEEPYKMLGIAFYNGLLHLWNVNINHFAQGIQGSGSGNILMYYCNILNSTIRGVDMAHSSATIHDSVIRSHYAGASCIDSRWGSFIISINTVLECSHLGRCMATGSLDVGVPNPCLCFGYLNVSYSYCVQGS